MNIILRKTVLSMVMAGMVLPGCAIQKDLATAKDAVKSTTAKVDGLRERMVDNAASGAITTLSRPRLAGEMVQIKKSELPIAFSRTLSWRTHGIETMGDLFRTFTEMTGLTVRSGEIAPQGTNGIPTVDNSMMNEKVTLVFNGSVKGFLDEVASRLDVSWRYDSKTKEIEFFRYETKAISLFLPPGKKGVNASINLSAGATSPSGNVSVDHVLSVDPWASIMSGITSILGVDGAAGAPIAAGSGSLTARGKSGYAVANPELGVVTVTARPATLAKIGSYLESVNKRFAQNVLIDVKVFNVQMDANSSAGASMSLLKTALNKYNLSVVSADLVRSEASNLPTQVMLDTSSATGGMMSSVVAEALRQIGNVSLQTQGQVYAVNGQPSPFQQAREINYIASSTTTAVPNAGVTTTVQPGTRIVGFTANFLPQILGDNRILLQYQLQMSSLVSLRTIGTTGNQTQLPEITSQSLQQQAFLRDGQAVLLFGFDQERQSESGIDGLLSVSRAARNERNLNVVLIQVNTGAKHGEI